MSRWVLAAASTVITAGICYVGYQQLRSSTPSVDLVDDTEAYDQLLRERQQSLGTDSGEAQAQSEGGAVATAKGTPDKPAAKKRRPLDKPPADQLERATAPQPGPAGSWPPPLLREPLPEDMARNIFASLRQDQNVYHPQAYYIRKPDMKRKRRFEEHPNRRYVMQTNGQSFFNDEEVGPKDGARIMVTGDSHIEGVCFNAEAAPQLLAGLINEQRPGAHAMAFNAGVGGYQPYNYLGALERSLEFEPDVFVMIVYGGNDLSGMIRLERYFSGRGPMSLEPFPPRALALVKRNPEVRGQEVAQVLYFLNNPGDVQVACDTLASITMEARRVADEAGVKLLCAYLPPVLAGQPQRNAEWRAELARDLGIFESDIDVSSRIADCWIAWMESIEQPCVDLRPIFAAEPESLFWESDQHINLLGQQRVAEGLLPAVLELLD